MNPAELHRKMIAVARRNPPGDQVPLAFEKRIMALIREIPQRDQWELWAHALWRGAMACLVVTILFGALSFIGPRGSSAPTDLSQDFESTMLASVDQDADAAVSR
jgi:hypothetical protein